MKMPRVLAVFFFLIPWAAAFAGLVWLALLRFPPSGIFDVSTRLDGKSAWIFPFLPGERVSIPGSQPDGWVGQRILSDPVYFTARVPGPYDTVDVEFEFRSVQQPLMEFGLIRDAEGKSMEMRPLFASELQTSDWHAAQSGSWRGFVRTGVSPSRIADPDTRGLAVWVSTSSLPLIQDLPTEETTTNLSLRGAHDFYFVPTDKARMTFFLQAVNRKIGNDLVSFRVFRGDEEIHREAFTVSGSQDIRMGETIAHTIDLPEVKPGVHRISVLTNDDVFIRKIVTPSRRWVVGPRLVFGDVVGYATSTQQGRVWTTSRHAVLETFHVEGLQTVSLGPAQIELKKTHTSLRLDRTDDIFQPVELRAPQGDVRIIGDGYFAFSPEAFFEPAPRRLTSSTLVKSEHIDAVVTPYERPQALGDGWYRSHSTFTIDPALDRLRFVFSTPGVLARGGAVDIRNIRLTYHRAAVTYSDWWLIMKRELVNAWRRL